MKSVMSLEMHKKLKLNELDTSSIPHVVGASDKSLGTRGRTRCEININRKAFYIHHMPASKETHDTW